MKLNKYYIIGAVVLVLIAGFFLMPEEQTPVTSEKKLDTVSTELVSTNDLVITYTTVGRLSSKDETKVTALASGQIEEVYVKKGDQVKKGQKLFKLKSEEVTRGNEQNYQSAIQAYNVAVKVHKDAQDSYNKTKKLFDAGVASKSELNQAKLQLDQTTSSKESARIALEGAKTTKDLKAEDLVVESPVDGYLRSFDIRLHENYQQNEVVIESSNVKIVKIGIPEKHIDKISAKTPVSVWIKSKDLKLEGQVMTINSDIIPNTGLYEVTVSLEADDLRNGLYCELDLELEKKSAQVMIPNKAVILTSERPHVYVVEGGYVVKKDIELGIKQGKLVTVTQGLSPGEELIVLGQSKVSEGVQVDILN